MLKARMPGTRLLIAALIGLVAVPFLLSADSVSSSGQVTFSGLPTHHGGEKFSFTLTFNVDDHPTSYTTVPDEVTVVGGSVDHVRRATKTGPDRNKSWVISIEPTASDDVTLTVRGVSATVPKDEPDPGSAPIKDGNKIVPVEEEERISARQQTPTTITWAEDPATIDEGTSRTIDYATTHPSGTDWTCLISFTAPSNSHSSDAGADFLHMPDSVLPTRYHFTANPDADSETEEAVYTLTLTCTHLTEETQTATDTLTVWSNDDEASPGFVFDPATIEVVEGGPRGTVRFKLATKLGDREVVVVQAREDDIEPGCRSFVSTRDSSEKEFNSSNWNIYQTLSFSAPQRTTALSPTCNVELHVVTPVVDVDGYSNLPADRRTIVVRHLNTTPGIIVDPPSVTITENGPPGKMTVRLATEPAGNAVITVESADTNALTVSPDQLTFTPDNWDEPQDVTLRGVDDADDEDEENVKVFIFPRSGYAGRSPQTPLVTVIDDESLFVDGSGNPLETSSLNEGESVHYDFRLREQPPQNVTVSFTVHPAGLEGEISITPASRTFTPQNWDQTQRVTVTAVADSDDVHEDWYVRFSTTSADPDWSGIQEDIAIKVYSPPSPPVEWVAAVATQREVTVNNKVTVVNEVTVEWRPQALSAGAYAGFRVLISGSAAQDLPLDDVSVGCDENPSARSRHVTIDCFNARRITIGGLKADTEYHASVYPIKEGEDRQPKDFVAGVTHEVSENSNVTFRTLSTPTSTDPVRCMQDGLTRSDMIDLGGGNYRHLDTGRVYGDIHFDRYCPPPSGFAELNSDAHVELTWLIPEGVPEDAWWCARLPGEDVWGHVVTPAADRGALTATLSGDRQEDCHSRVEELPEDTWPTATVGAGVQLWAFHPRGRAQQHGEDTQVTLMHPVFGVRTTVTVGESDLSVEAEDLRLTTGGPVDVELPEATGGFNYPGTGYTYAIAGTLPAGLAFDAATRSLTGTPTATQGAQTYTFSVTDGAGHTASDTFTMEVREPFTMPQQGTATGACDTSTRPLQFEALIGVETSINFPSPSGGYEPYTYYIAIDSIRNVSVLQSRFGFSPMVDASVDGSTITLYDGTTLAGQKLWQLPASRTVSVTPTTSGVSDQFLFFYVATDDVGVTRHVGGCLLRVKPLVLENPDTFDAYTENQLIDPVSLTVGTAADHPLAFQIPGTGGLDSDLTYTIRPELPAGLTFDTARGYITGTPTAIADSQTYTLTVTGRLNTSASVRFNLEVNPRTLGQISEESDDVGGQSDEPPPTEEDEEEQQEEEEPSGTRIVSTTQTSVRVGWDRLRPGGTHLQDARVHYREAGESTWTFGAWIDVSTWGADTQEATVDGLTCGTDYEFLVEGQWNDTWHEHDTVDGSTSPC